ncbi:class I SAM-dependent methyltransferase [Variovorax sp. EL159]|uniref:class I SAM-dependent methyltransferase n=1 Tax=Variovorax sp. EL159 TaxID=1566270 RepID=UPI000891783C|nr:class I SAM-dependent methyltransferase [Variovorax sp. EL159]SCX59351.1 Glycosyltransferase, GT2 family [Variovorax sp. EL159]
MPHRQQQHEQPQAIAGEWLPASASLGDLTSPTLSSIFRRPQRIGKPSGWWGHVPFAAWVVEACEPRMLVELGTHYGVSYAAFCEAVLHAGLPTRCYAVDHWQGDAHAGRFGDKVFQELLEFNQQHYAAFSELVRMDFDAAVDTFEDGTIDLLHIDGFHTYEAARHDFDTWKRKLSPRAVVLFHDTNVRQGDFGVYRLFAELAAGLPHFEFLHGHGLGVIAHGPQAPAAIRQLCAASHGSATLSIRDRFAIVGAVWAGLAREQEAQQSFRLQVEALQGHHRAAEAARDAAQGQLDQALRERDDAVAQTRNAVRAERERDVALGRAYLLQARLQEAATRPASSPSSRSEDIVQLEARFAELQAKLAHQAEHLADAEQTRRALTEELAQSTQHHATAVRWFEEVQKERTALIAATLGMRDHLATYTVSVGRMVSDLVRRHGEVIGFEPATGAAAQAVTPPDRPGVLSRLRPKTLPAALRWLAPAVRRYRMARHPVAQVVRHSMLFDAQWYADTYLDVRRSSVDPAYHYAMFGSREARDPSPWFSTSGYLRHNPDVAQAGTNALYHFEAFGRREQRPFVPGFAQVQPPGVPATGLPATTITTPAVAADLKQTFRADSEAALGAFLARPDARIGLPVSAQPAVSIVLVLHNQAGLTFRCLEALAQAIDVPAEVIVVDNASSDRTAALLARVDGCRMFAQSENLHFLRGANAGAREARGRHVLFLNNDTQLAPGSLAAACSLLDAKADVGAVGGRIVLLDGTLQEAGSIIWRDGDCSGHGRGQDPADAAFQFRRDVDYCSGAFLMVRRTLFESLAGFDPLFAPAYYEDTDLCMRVREAGFRVVYEPAVLLTHFEFGSAASDDDAARLMTRHRTLFAQRHARTLAETHRARSHGELAARQRSNGRASVLVIDDQVPIPNLGAGNPRACNLINALHRAGALLTHYPVAFPACDAAAAARCLPAELERVTGSGRPTLADFLRSRIGLFDLVVVSRPHNMEVFRRACEAVPGFLDHSRVVYDAEALFSARETLRREVLGLAANPQPGAMTPETELRQARSAAVVLAVSEAEARSFRQAGCPDVRVLGHCLEPMAADAGAGFDARRDFLFVGRLDEEDSPNADSVRWFVDEVMPRLDARIGTAYGVDIVGGCSPALRARLGNSRVRFHGRVDNVQAHYDHARVFLAPTRFAAGIPHKVHEASAQGLPSVATPLIAEQLGWASGDALLSAATPADFAAACASLYQDRVLWERLRDSGLARVAQDCAPARFDGVVQSLLRDVPHQSLPALQDAARALQTARTAKEWSRPLAERNETQGLFWMSHPQVMPRLNRLASGQPNINAYDHLKNRLSAAGWQFPVRRVASLGCGFGALERDLAGLGIAERIDGYDLAAPAIEEARRLAAEAGLQGLHYHLIDLEREPLPENAFDIVFASHSIHHIENLDGLFASVRRALRPGGVFHLSEFIGPDHFQWTDAQLQGINEFMATLPLKYRRFPSGMERGVLSRPSVAEVIAVDPSEAVCSSQIVDAVGRHFRVEEFRPLGGALLQTGLSGIAQNFDPSDPEDAAHLQRFFDFEDRWMAEGLIGSDFAVITAVRD